MPDGTRLIASAALAVLSMPLAVGISACGEDNPAQRAIDSQVQQIQDQANRKLNQQTEQVRKQAQQAIDQATGKANEAIDQAQSQVNQAIPPPPERP